MRWRSRIRKKPQLSPLCQMVPSLEDVDFAAYPRQDANPMRRIFIENDNDDSETIAKSLQELEFTLVTNAKLYSSLVAGSMEDIWEGPLGLFNAKYIHKGDSDLLYCNRAFDALFDDITAIDPF